MAKKQAPQAPQQTAAALAVAAALTADQSAYFTSAGTSYGTSALAEGRRDAELAEALKACTTTAAWNEAGKTFQSAATVAGYLAAADLWDRTIRRLRSLGMIGDKPKATGKEATKKAAQREKAVHVPTTASAAEAVKVQTAALAEVEKLTAKAAALKGKAKAAAEAKATDAALKAQAAAKDIAAHAEAASKAAAEAAAARIKNLREQFDSAARALRSAADAALLQRAIETIRDMTPPTAAEKAAAKVGAATL